MEVIVIAGASFPCGVSELGEAARRNGTSPLFLDHPQNAPVTAHGLSPMRFESGIPSDIAQQSGLLLPLLESWVSEGSNLPLGARLRFDRRAALISRSKLKLSMTLAEDGLPSVRRRRVATAEGAVRAASECGYPAVLRADAGYSGRGVWIADSPDDVRRCWEKHSVERAGGDYAEMQTFLRATDGEMLIEPWLAGDEWSLDCVVGPAGTSLIRVCQKVTTTVGCKPFTLGYRLTDSAELCAELRQVVTQWTRALFQERTVMFACFDIRRDSSGQLVPLDFGVRLGSDRIPLLVRRACVSGNPYAAALDSALADDPGRMTPVPGGYSIVHAFADQPGTFDHLSLSREGEVIESRPTGFRVERQEGFPVFRRVGTVLAHFSTYDQFRAACLSSGEWVRVHYR